MDATPMQAYRSTTRKLAKGLKWTHVYYWLIEHGYFPESYVLPPCFRVKQRPNQPRRFVSPTKKYFKLVPKETCNLHFPKTDLTDRTFGIIDPELHNDIAYHIARNWKIVVDRLIPKDSQVTCYSFPVPVDSKHHGRVGHLRGGRMIYEFLWMTEEDLVSSSHRYTHLVQADIKSFYPSIYTHSLAWAIHGKRHIRKGNNRHDYTLLGNRLDRLFQYSNDQRTNGIPIGPVVSDIVSEIVAAAVDRALSKSVVSIGLDCEMTRFKDDYRILVRGESDGESVIKLLQAALKRFDLELSEQKTSIHELPDGLFRPWVSLYHAAYPKKRQTLSWKEFRELYLTVLRIDEHHPGTGVIDRFLADIVSKKGRLSVHLTQRNVQKAMSMLIMLGHRRNKAFPKILAIIESVLRSPFGQKHIDDILLYIDFYLKALSEDEERNTYLISWLAYFVVSNRLKNRLTFTPAYKSAITRSVFNNRGNIFRDSIHFKIFEGCCAVAKRGSMLEYLDIFDPPRPT